MQDEKNILIVEDDHVMRNLIKRTVFEIGIEVKRLHEAINGKRGLEVLKYFHIDLILTDINMPGMDGLEMLAYMQKILRFRYIPVVVISSEKDERLINALNSWGLGYIHKPVTVQALKNQIVKLETNTYGWT